MPRNVKTLALAIAAGAVLAAPVQAEDTEVSIRLEWVIQTQFAGFIVAEELGYYAEEGLDVTIRPASPDLKAAVTVVQGTDTFGVGHPHQVIAARSNDAPLVTVLQHGQKTANVYVSRKELGIETPQDVPGHSVGLWFGGDEFEFMSLLSKEGVDTSDIQFIAQGFSIAPWMQGDYDVMMVTRYNELLQVYDQGLTADKLNIIDANEYGTGLLSAGGLFTSERMIEDHPEVVQGFVNASMRGWQWALANIEEASEIVVGLNSELTLGHQVAQLEAMRGLICDGPTLDGKFGMSDMKNWEISQTILLEGEQINRSIDLEKGFTNSFWDNAPEEYKSVDCG